MAELIERPNYYQLQFLGADDFKAEQAYHRDMRRRHNIGPHRWGIVTGLELVERPRDGGGFDVYIEPGMAIDGFGREIFIVAPAKLDAAEFQFITGNVPTLHTVWLAYREESSSPPEFGYGTCESDARNDRVREDARIVIDPSGDTHAAIVVDGRAAAAENLPEDQSVPYQELPDAANARWLVPLGSVSWDPTVPGFVSAGAQLAAGRVYAGIVAEEVLGPNAKVRVRPRKSFSAADVDRNDFAFIEGRLRVKGSIVEEKDIYLDGGKLSFRDGAGSDATVPLWMQRMGGNANEYDLRIHIGGDSDGAKHRLTVGSGADPVSLTTEKVYFAVRGDDRVDIPTGTLSMGQKTRQMITLWGSSNDAKPPYGIGVQSSALYFRTGGHVYWYRNGVHHDDLGNAGTDGEELLHLDDAGRLHFGAKTRQMLNLYNDDYAVGVQNSTLYARSNRDFCWFRGGNHADARSSPGGGTLAMKLDEHGDLSVERHLDAAGSLTIGGSLVLGGNLNMAPGSAMILDGTRFPIDIRTGEVVILPGGQTSGQRKVQVNSRLNKVTGGAFFHVALADISHDGANNTPQWGVTAHINNLQLDDNTFEFTFDWKVNSTHASINLVSYVAFFIA